MKKTTVIFFIIIIVLLVVLLSLQLVYVKNLNVVSSPEGVWSAHASRELANTLLAKGLKGQAIEAFKEYYATADLSSKDMARIAYKIGSLYMDQYQYEKAMQFFIRAEMLDNEADFKEEMNEAVVVALENLGLSTQAQYELQARTSVHNQTPQQGQVVARIGDDFIMSTEIDKALANLPEWVRAEYDTPDKKQQFLEEYVSTEVLYRKARRQGFERTPAMREAVENFKKQYMIQQLIGEHVTAAVTIDEEDIRLYYRAHMDTYVEPEAVRVSYVHFDDLEKEEQVRASLQKDGGKEINAWIVRGQEYIPDCGEHAQAISDFFDLAVDQISKRYQIDDKYYLFKVNDKREERQKSFEEVKQQIFYELQAKERNNLTQKLLKEALEEQQVEVFGLENE